MRVRARLLALFVAASVASASASCASSSPPAAHTAFDETAASRDVARELDDFHDAAAHADEPRYFAHFAPGGVFLGTDATERWTIDAFRAYAHPRFAEGHGWTYRVARRSIAWSEDGDVAWFDEDLVGEKTGATRGSGVVVRRNGRYLIAQYNLTVPIPNAKFAAVRALIDAP